MTISKRIIISFILFMCFTNNTFGSRYVKINAELNMARSWTSTIDLNSDLRVRTSLLPESIEMLCTGGKLRGSQVTCGPGLWVDIESTMTMDSSMSMFIDSAVFTLPNMTETRRARCTSHDNSTLDCAWTSNIDAQLNISPYDGSQIIKQDLKLHIEPSSYDYAQSQYIDGEITYNTQKHQVSYDPYSETAYGNTNSIKAKISIIDSNFGTSITTTMDNRMLFYSDSVQIIASIDPENLTASFYEYSEITSINKQFSGPKTNELITNIFLRHGGMPCYVYKSDSICAQIIDNATVSIACKDKNMQIEAIPCDQNNTECARSQMVELRGTWGRVNIDTDCAVTVLLPYE
ncbi:hypothetical protein DQ806_12725 [Salmonella enterica subsp. enterica serovar Okatie]|nr:hypothetical protein [Salmonella enterica subsp. enterica serovar Okatie]